MQVWIPKEKGCVIHSDHPYNAPMAMGRREQQRQQEEFWIAHTELPRTARENILKRVLIHVGGLNLSLVMRQLLGQGTPRGLQGLSADVLLILSRFWIATLVHTEQESASMPMPSHALRIDISILLRAD